MKGQSFELSPLGRKMVVRRHVNRAHLRLIPEENSMELYLEEISSPDNRCNSRVAFFFYTLST